MIRSGNRRQAVARPEWSVVPGLLVVVLVLASVIGPIALSGEIAAVGQRDALDVAVARSIDPAATPVHGPLRAVRSGAVDHRAATVWRVGRVLAVLVTALLGMAGAWLSVRLAAVHPGPAFAARLRAPRGPPALLAV